MTVGKSDAWISAVNAALSKKKTKSLHVVKMSELVELLNEKKPTKEIFEYIKSFSNCVDNRYVESEMSRLFAIVD